MRLARNPLGVVTRKSVELWPETRLELWQETRLELWPETRLKLWLENRMESWRENRLELWKKFDKIRPGGWITLTRLLINRNIFPLTR